MGGLGNNFILLIWKECNLTINILGHVGTQYIFKYKNEQMKKLYLNILYCLLIKVKLFVDRFLDRLWIARNTVSTFWPILQFSKVELIPWP